MSNEHAEREVEETLRLARDEVERLIATLRVVTFAIVALLVSAIQYASPTARWTPALYFAGCFVYALALRALVSRVGGATWLALTAVVADVIAMSAVFLVARPARLDPAFTVPAYVLGPSLVGLMSINMLRASRLTAIVGALVAFVAFYAVILTHRGPEAGQSGAATVILIGGLVGVASARRTRQTLELFARLHLLRRFVPAPLVERVVQSGGAAVNLAGEERELTLLASDLRGFTAFAEELPPTEVVRQLNAFHTAMLDVVKRHGGALDKFIGDGMLVVFGLDPDTAPDHGASDAVACAREMLVALERHNVARSAEGLPPFAAGIGVHTGHVVAGSIGDAKGRQEFTVIGDAVNTAARLESLTKDAGKCVLVSGATVARLSDKNGLTALSPVSIRGKQRTMEVYALAHEPGGSRGRSGQDNGHDGQ